MKHFRRIPFFRSFSVRHTDMSIPLWTFHRESQQWMEKKFTSGDVRISREVLRLLSYNIWFSNEHQPRRFQGLCRILEESQADVIGLQEVTVDVLRKLCEVPFIRARYSLSDLDGQTFKTWYGVILLVANDLPVYRLSQTDFPRSEMGRRLILVDLRLRSSGDLLRIGTVHLESLNNAEQRAEQLKICEREFSRQPGHHILMGDFNFSDQHRENVEQFQRLPGWRDVWTLVKNENDFRYTFDTETNSMTKLSNGGSDRSRYDRIIVKSDRVRAREMNIIGKEPIAYDGHLQIFPSDHFGLTALFDNIE